jgi:hypothetical protein
VYKYEVHTWIWSDQAQSPRCVRCEEILHRGEHQYAVEDRSEDIGTPIFGSILETRGPGIVVFVSLSGGVFDEAPFCYRSFLGRQPPGVSREIRQDEQS